MEKYKKTVIHYVLAKFLKDSLDFLADDPRANGMKRMDWINDWIETEYENTINIAELCLKDDD